MYIFITGKFAKMYDIFLYVNMSDHEYVMS